MRDFVASDWQSVLRLNGLDSFESLWGFKGPWFEEPNHRRGGWSGVVRHQIISFEGKRKTIFIKRQENHCHRTLLHPLRGEATYAREMRNIVRFQAHHLAPVEPVFFAQRIYQGNVRVVLVTAGLEGFTAFDELLRRWHRVGRPQLRWRAEIIQALARTLRSIHACHFQYNSFFPNHVFLKINPSGNFGNKLDIDVRVIDLESVRWRPVRLLATLRDLYSFYRRSRRWVGNTDCLRFLLAYRQDKHLTRRTKWIGRRIEKRTRAKLRQH